MSDSTQTTQQSQQSQTTPWTPAQGLLTNLLGGYGSQSTAVTPGQSTALTNLQGATANLPDFGSQGTSAVNNLFGSSTAPQVGMLNNAYGTLTNNLGSTASGANLNPYTTPGFGDAINTMTNDITNATKGVYAASGRDPAGAGSFAQSLGRGLTQGIAPTIASQYNQNYGNMINANNSLFSGAGSTASGITNLNQTQLSNGVTGLQAASTIPGLYTSPYTSQLGAANAGYSQPYQNLAQLLQPSTALAGLGGESSGSGTSTQTQQGSLLSSILGGVTGGVGALGTTGAFGSAGWLAPLMLSDANVKENIAPVGKLADGQTVHSFNFKGNPKPQIGLIAQEVQQHVPEAVHEIHGVKHVDYEMATRRARSMMNGPVGALRAAA